MARLYPLRFVPVYKDYIWGGHGFAKVFGRQLDPDKIYAESWEIADHPQGQSVVEAGPLAGRTLHELLQENPKALLGQTDVPDRFPLLIKFLDACQRLSVQVHPDDRLAAQMGLKDPGKTEAWVIIAAEPGSRIWAGFNQTVDRHKVEQAVKSGRLEELLHWFEPKPGQCLFIPAGTVHALGEGILVAEVQQTSDNTFRLFDWNRVGKDGKPRPLHIEEALQAIDYEQGAVLPRPPEPSEKEGVEVLVRCDKFVIERHTLRQSDTIGGDERFHILIVLEGQLRVEGDPVQEPARAGQTLLIPAELQTTVYQQGEKPVVFLDVYLP